MSIGGEHRVTADQMNVADPERNPMMTTIGRLQRRTLLVAALVALSATTAACDLVGTRGEGAVKSETRQTDAFSRVESGGGIHVSIGIGDASALEVRAQGNLLPLITTEVVDGTLRIQSSEAYTTSETIEVILTTPELERIVLSGGSRGTIDDLSSDAFDVELNGGSVLTASGTASTVTLQVSGGSVAELEALTAATITVDLSGGSRAEVRATDRVNGSATGGSRVSVAGGAKTTVDTTGGSQVDPAR
jgi:predicted small secreted protein